MPTHLLRLDNQGRPFRLISRNELQADYFQEFSEVEINRRIDQINSQHSTTRTTARETAIRSLVRDSLKYAIFSHRWLRMGEPTFTDIAKLPQGGGMSGEGFFKLEKFCEKAFAHGCKLAWSDTCCINKRDSSELEEAIRAMFKWYRNAHICIAYLHQSSTLFDFSDDEWFKRGWTLQELLAPRTMKFYQKDWGLVTNSRNDKDNLTLVNRISEVTKIPSEDLQKFTPGFTRVHEKMAWASGRKTTRVEDTAYSLIGLFDLSMSVAYGEGKWAFYRLMETILHRSHGWDILAWAGPSCPYNEAIPDVPQCYTAFDPTLATELDTDVGESHWRGDQSFEMTKRGLEVETLIIPLKTPSEDSDTFTVSPTDDSFHDTFVTRFHNKAEDTSKRPDWAIGPQWAVGVLNYKALDGRVYTHQGRMEADRHYVCLLLKLDTSVNIRRLSWKRIFTRDVLIIKTKRELEGQLETIWL
jgi:hypothetical protein